MDILLDFLHRLRSPRELIEWGGYVALVAIVFSETGLLVGFFLPGDSLLVTAGLFAAKGDLNVVTLMVLLSIAAIVGDTVGYWFGAKTGPPLYSRPNSRFFKRQHLLKAHAFYEKYGGITIVVARFMPLIRTFAPIVAGAAGMNYRRFLAFNFLGAVLWAIGVTMLGYTLGHFFGSIEGVDRYFTLLVLAFFFIPGLPTLIHLWRDNRERILGWVKARLRRQRAPEV